MQLLVGFLRGKTVLHIMQRARARAKLLVTVLLRTHAMYFLIHARHHVLDQIGRLETRPKFPEHIQAVQREGLFRV
jgi:hypothetical protein